MTDTKSVSAHLECVNSLVINRKIFEYYIDLACKNYNEPRLDLAKRINTYYKDGVETPLSEQEKKNLTFVCKTVPSELKILKALFSYNDYSNENLDLSNPGIFPGEERLMQRAHLKKSQMNKAKKIIKEKNLADWDNRYGESRRPGHHKDSISNSYIFLPAIIALAKFTEHSLKKELTEEDIKDLNEQVIILKQDKNLSLTSHQKSAKSGAIVKKRNAKNIDLAKYALKELEKGKDRFRYKRTLAILKCLISRLNQASKKTKKQFKIDKTAKIEGYKKKKKADLKLLNKPLGGQKSEPGGQKLAPGGPFFGPINTQSKSPDELTKYNLTTTVEEDNQKPVDNSKFESMSSSLKNFLFLEGFRFTSSYLDKMMREILKKYHSEAGFKQIVLDLKKSLTFQNLWQIFVYTTTSLSRFEHDEATIIHGCNKQKEEARLYAKQGSLLEFPRFRKFFKTKEEAYKAIFPEDFAKKEAKKKKEIEWLYDYPEKLRKDFLESEDFKSTVCSVEVVDLFKKYVKENHPEVEEAVKENKIVNFISRMKSDIEEEILTSHDPLPRVPLLDDLISKAFRLVYESGKKPHSPFEYYIAFFKEQDPEGYLAWQESRERQELINLGYEKCSSIPQAVKLSSYIQKLEKNSEQSRDYLYGKCWVECGFDKNQKLYTKNVTERQKIIEWFRDSCENFSEYKEPEEDTNSDRKLIDYLNALKGGK